MLSAISTAVRSEKAEQTALMTAQGRLASWQVWALREQRDEAIANIAALAKGDIVIRDKHRPEWEYTMWRKSDVGRLNRFLDSVNSQLEGYE